MTLKRDSASLDLLVTEALDRMREVMRADACYEIDRTSAQWVVTRAYRTSASGFPADVISEIVAADRS